MVALDIRKPIVAVMAYTGAQSPDDRKVIKEAFITFATAGHHIQWTEITLAPWVPLLGRDLLSECVRYGGKLSQCGCVTASWIFAMLYGDAREEEDRAGYRAACETAEEKRKRESRLVKAV
ncbi:hypothetical protein DL768_010888 [Monosporascus sp. mg162]|nr:hypothetical protein DL768_010888 [Monosporascus sp. mg162]